MSRTPQEWGDYWGPICFPRHTVERYYDEEKEEWHVREKGFTDEEIERALRRPYKPTLMRRDVDDTLVA